MYTGGVIIHTNQVSQIGSSGQNVLKEGSQILVRVISDKGNGKYEGSVAGTRVTLQSSKKLEPGKTFLATISAKDGTIYISPKETSIVQQQVQINTIQNEQLANLLKQLGLPADELSLHLFQQLKQMGLKLDVALLKKLHTVSLKFNGKEKAASEILMILKEKGIEATESEIMNLLLELDGDFSSKDSEENKKFELLNKINQKEGKWFLVPFEIIQKNNETVIGNGNLKLMYLAEQLSLLNVDCNYNNLKYLFSLKFNNRKLEKVNFNIEGFDYKAQLFSNQLKEKLSLSKLNDVEVQWVDKALVEGTACGSEEISSVGGVV